MFSSQSNSLISRLTKRGHPVAQLTDINIKAEILGRKYVSSRCDWGSLATKPSLSSLTELRVSWGLIKKGKYKAKIQEIKKVCFDTHIIV